MEVEREREREPRAVLLVFEGVSEGVIGRGRWREHERV
jgi:hypothetical protein